MGGQAIKHSDRVPVNQVNEILKSFCDFYNFNPNKLHATGSTSAAIIKNCSYVAYLDNETIGDLDLIFDVTCHLWESLTTVSRPHSGGPRAILLNSLLSVNPDLEYYYNHSANIISLAYYYKNSKYQVDLICTIDVDFTLWMYGTHRNQNSKYKNLYRNSLFSACSHFINYQSWEGLEERFLFNYSSGLHFIKARTRALRTKLGKPGRLLKNPKETHREFITKDPDKIVQLLLGNYSLIAKNFRSFESVWEFLERNVDAELVDKIMNQHIVYLNKNNYDLPEEYKTRENI